MVGRPGVCSHVLDEIVEQVVYVVIGVGAVAVTPCAVVFVEGAVGFAADYGIIEGHAAALADEGAWGAEQCVDGYVVEL